MGDCSFPLSGASTGARDNKDSADGKRTHCETEESSSAFSALLASCALAFAKQGVGVSRVSAQKPVFSVGSLFSDLVSGQLPCKPTPGQILSGCHDLSSLSYPLDVGVLFSSPRTEHLPPPRTRNDDPQWGVRPTQRPCAFVGKSKAVSTEYSVLRSRFQSWMQACEIGEI